MFNLNTYPSKVPTNFVFNEKDNTIEFDCGNNLDDYLKGFENETASRHFFNKNKMGRFFKLESFPFYSNDVKLRSKREGKVILSSYILHNFKQHFIEEFIKDVKRVTVNHCIRYLTKQLDEMLKTELEKVEKNTEITKEKKVMLRKQIEEVFEEKRKSIPEVANRTIEGSVEQKEIDHTSPHSCCIYINDSRVTGTYIQALEDLIRSIYKGKVDPSKFYKKEENGNILLSKKILDIDFINKHRSHTTLLISRDLCKTLGTQDSKVQGVKYALINTIFNVSGVMLFSFEDNKGECEYIVPAGLGIRKLDDGKSEYYERELSKEEVDEINAGFRENGLFEGDFLIKNKAQAYVIPHYNLDPFIADGFFPIRYSNERQCYEYEVEYDLCKFQELQSKLAEEKSYTEALPPKRSATGFTKAPQGNSVQRSQSFAKGDIHKSKKISGILSQSSSDHNLKEQDNQDKNYLAVSGKVMSTSWGSQGSSGYGSGVIHHNNDPNSNPLQPLDPLLERSHPSTSAEKEQDKCGQSDGIAKPDGMELNPPLSNVNTVKVSDHKSGHKTKKNSATDSDKSDSKWSRFTQSVSRITEGCSIM